MISDEKLKSNLQFAFEVCSLYLKSGASTADISVATEVPFSTVKKQLKMISRRKEDYLRLLPSLGTEEDLNAIQALIDEQINDNKKINKWNDSGIALDNFAESIDIIKQLYNQNKQDISEETKTKIREMKVNGDSFRKISNTLGVSLASISKVLTIRTDSSEKSK